MKLIHKPVNLVSKLIINILTNFSGDLGAAKATSPNNRGDLSKNRKRLRMAIGRGQGGPAGIINSFDKSLYIY